MKLQELNVNELKNVNGGADRSMLSGLLGGFINLSNTDDDGDTESTNLDFGLGSILDFMND